MASGQQALTQSSLVGTRGIFIVDGEVTVDKGPGRVEPDDFGGTTGILTVNQTPDGDLNAF